VGHCHVRTCKILPGPVQQNGEQNQGREEFRRDGGETSSWPSHLRNQRFTKTPPIGGVFAVL